MATPSPFIQITPQKAIMKVAGQIQGQSRRGLRSLQREVNRNAELINQLGAYRDLNVLSETASNQPATLEALNSLNAIQSNLAIDVFSGGNATTMPSAQEMQQEILRGNNIATEIAEELQGCCEELKRLVNRVLTNLEKAKRDILNGETKIIRLIKQSFIKLRRDLTTLYLQEKEKLRIYVDAVIEQVIERLITSFKNEIVASENRVIEKVKREITASESRIINRFENKLSETENRLTSKLNALEETLANINREVVALGVELTTLAEAFGAYVTLYESNQAFLVSEIGAGFTAVEASFVTLKGVLKGKALINTRTYNRHIDAKEKELEKFSTEKIKEEHEYWNEKVENLPKTIAYEASLAIVGEPYRRYDAISCYYPTLVFIFYEETAAKNRRRAQIKLRLLEKIEDLTSERIEEIKHNVSKESNLNFMAGNTRANYVSADKRMKTSIYCEDAKNAEFILDKTLSLISDTFDKSLLSITTNGTKRPNLGKRKRPLANIDLNTENYNKEFKVKLHHANLLVNGIKHIIPIWSS